MSDSAVRLNKLLAAHLGIGRRQADELIAQKRVVVNGAPAQPGQRASAQDAVTVDGKVVALTEKPAMLYLLLHKPVGYVCSRRKQGPAPTIYSLLPPKYHHLHPVGRLDKDSSGLLLLTNDGDLALRMTHPKFGKRKTYEVTLDAPLEPLHRQMIAEIGIALPDGNSQLQLERVQENNNARWRVIMHEGRNRQIRRTFAALGYTVTRLHRTQFGPFELEGLKVGGFRQITLE